MRAKLAPISSYTYEGADRLYERTKGRLAASPNYRLERHPDRYEFWLYASNVLTYYTDGRVFVSDCGWDTMTTRHFLHHYSKYAALAHVPCTITPDGRVDKPRADFSRWKTVPKVPEAMKGMSRQFRLREEHPYYLCNLPRELTKREYARAYHYSDSYKQVEVPCTSTLKFLGED